MNTDTHIVPSSGNLFADLGFAPAEAQVMAMRVDLMVALEKPIKSRAVGDEGRILALPIESRRFSDF